jgi:outer membrane immunogenic protein
MNRLLSCAGALALAAVAHSASAADMPARVAKAPAMVAAPIFNWSGYYAGVQGGYGWGRSEFCDQAACLPEFTTDGWFGGVTLGHNWQTGIWVLGVETDFSLADIEGGRGSSDNFGCGGGVDRCESEVNWFGTLRGRIGPANDRAYAYLTGGLAYARLGAALVTDPGKSERTSAGWTAGAGIEFALAPNWTGKFEYLYLAGFKDVTASTICTRDCVWKDPDFHIVRAGLNYRFATGGKAPVAAPVVTKY